VESQKSKMSKLKFWIKLKWFKFKNSKFFLAILMLIIGISYTYCFLTIKYEYRESVIGRVVIFNNSSVALASTARENAGANQEVEKVASPEVRGEEQSSPTVRTIKKYFGDEWKTAYAVMMAESHGDPSRIGDTHLSKPSIGLFQINQIWHPYTVEQLQDPEFNIKTAKDIRDSGGWERWTTYRTGQYEKFLNQI